MKYWIITDTHFEHYKIIDFCSRPSDYNDQILRNLQCIQKDDILIHLGDVAWLNEKWWHLEFLKHLPCKTWLVRGNHDKRSDSWYLDVGWDFVGESIILNRFKKNILLSHIPQKDTGYDINVHGHFHNLGKGWFSPKLSEIKNDKHVLIKIEHTYSPIKLKTIVENFNKEKSWKLEEPENFSLV